MTPIGVGGPRRLMAAASARRPGRRCRRALFLAEAAVAQLLVAPISALVTPTTTTTPPALAPRVYWTAAEEEHAGHIYAMGGAEGQGVLVSGLRHPSSIAVDPWSSKIFWTDSRDQTVSKANLDGSGVEVILTNLQNPLGLTVDGPRGTMYFGDGGRVVRSDVNGKSTQELGSGFMIVATVISWTERRLYWCDSMAAKIVRYNLDDGSTEDVVTNILDPSGLALDLGRGKLYWSSSLIGAIHRSNLDGTKRELVFSGLTSPGEIAVNAEHGRIYWTRVARRAAVMAGDLNGTVIGELVTGTRISGAAFL